MPPTFEIWNSDCLLFSRSREVLFFAVGGRAPDVGYRVETMPTTITAARVFRFVVFFGVSVAYFMFLA